MTTIYLVEGSWSDYESQGYWAAKAFTTMAAAEQYRQKCQEWIDNYVHEFWEEFARRFGEPRERSTHCTFTDETTEQIMDENYSNPGNDLAEEWFGYRYIFHDDESKELDATDFGRNRMRRVGPDPLVDMSFVAGGKCHYHIVEVELAND